MKDLILGIDFGSENIYVAHLNNNVPHLVENANGGYYTPAYILEKSADSIIIGKIAKSKNGICWQKDPNQTTTFTFNQKQYLIKDFCLKIFKSIKDVYQQRLGDVLWRTVIALPIYLKQEVYSLVKECANEAGLNVMAVINEPTAIALNYWQNNPNNNLSNLVVYDLGACNLTISKVDILHQMLILTKACYYNPNLGLNTWINKQVEYFSNRARKELSTKYHNLDVDKPSLKKWIADSLVEAMTSLSQKKELILAIPQVMGIYEGNPVYLSQMSEKGIDSSYDIFIDPLKKVIANPNDDILITAGGGSQIKAMREKMDNLDFKEVVHIDNAAHASALGACWYGAIISGIIPGKLVLSLTNNLINMNNK